MYVFKGIIAVSRVPISTQYFSANRGVGFVIAKCVVIIVGTIAKWKAALHYMITSSTLKALAPTAMATNKPRHQSYMYHIVSV